MTIKRKFNKQFIEMYLYRINKDLTNNCSNVHLILIFCRTRCLYCRHCHIKE